MKDNEIIENILNNLTFNDNEEYNRIFDGEDYDEDDMRNLIVKAIKQTLKTQKEEMIKEIEFYFHKCWINKKVPKLEELKQKLEKGK